MQSLYIFRWCKENTVGFIQHQYDDNDVVIGWKYGVLFFENAVCWFFNVDHAIIHQSWTLFSRKFPNLFFRHEY